MEKDIKNKYIDIVNSYDYKSALLEMSKRIVDNSKNAPNEATIEQYFEAEVFSFFREHFGLLGFEYKPVKEMKTARRHTLRGRTDSAISSLVIEFKQPKTLSSTKNKKEATDQLCDYLTTLADKDSTLYQGFLTDGVKGCFIDFCDGTANIGEFCPIDGMVLDKLIRLIIKVDLIALNSKNLVKAICNPPLFDGVGFKLAKALFSIMIKGIHPKSQMLYDEWRQLFILAHDDVSKQQAILDRRKALEKLFEMQFDKNDEEYKALFCIQTAYAIIVKTIAFKVISNIKYNQNLLNFNSLIEFDRETLRKQLEYIENGGLFRDYGIMNLLEGDFFSWYVNRQQFNEELFSSLRELYTKLSHFSEGQIHVFETKCQDFFKELYQTMIPAAVRHSLGEYYTKKWLARSVITEVKSSLPHNWRSLDPCCGSGTFITVLIELVLSEIGSLSNHEKLNTILTRVKGIDLNPIAVMTARVNYFINIAHLIGDEQEVEIPIYLGDASYVPKMVVIEEVKCFEYTITTLQSPIHILIPQSMVIDSAKFSSVMTKIEDYIIDLDETSVYNEFLSICREEDKKKSILENLHSLAKQLVDLERRQWNGVWARIITNFLSTANLGKYDLVVGNPPWVDWKSLPSGYRDKIKALCISRHLFSGDGRTGGINLNICALITNVAAQNWLSENGMMALLMPEPLIFQQSYEGFRNLYMDDGNRLYFEKFVNWNKAGHPFSPVTQKFLTFYLGKKEMDYSEGVPTKLYVKKRGKSIEDKEDLDISDVFDIQNCLLGKCHTQKNFFSYAKDNETLKKYRFIAGESEYKGREGIEFYPQELLVFTRSGLPSRQGYTALKNMQNDKSKYHVPSMNLLLETEYLHPMIKGRDIVPFHAEISDYIVPFPYEKNNPQVPISYTELRKRAPKLARYYMQNKDKFKEQTSYSDMIIGKSDAEFYALARVGAYSYQKYYVAMRDNSNWAAAVVTEVETEWGGKKRPVFQNHAISICEDSKGHYIKKNEAYFICGIINTPIVTEFMMTSSDSRSFPIDPRIFIPKFDSKNETHKRISYLSQKAHKYYKDNEKIKKICDELNELYLSLSMPPKTN